MIAEATILIIVSILFGIGLILTVLGLPGTWVVLAGAGLYNVLTWSWAISKTTMLVLLGIVAAGEILEWLFTVYGAKKFQTSNFAIVGLVLGTIAGAVIGFPIAIVGSLVGALIGAFAGAFAFSLIESRSINKALLSGIGAFVTRIGSILVKVLLSVIMVLIFYLELMF